jgi:hypothetical protein
VPPQLDIEGVLRPGRILVVAGVDQQQFQPALLQHLPARLPVLPGGLHHHLGDALGLQPVRQGLQAGGERRVGADLQGGGVPDPRRPGQGRGREATTSSLPTSSTAARSTSSPTACPLLPARLCWRVPGRANRGNDAETRAHSRQFVVPGRPRINLGHGLARTNESRAWPGVAILIRRGGQRPWDLGRLRGEHRANGDASSVMTSGLPPAGRTPGTVNTMV